MRAPRLAQDKYFDGASYHLNHRGAGSDAARMVYFKSVSGAPPFCKGFLRPPPRATYIQPHVHAGIRRQGPGGNLEDVEVEEAHYRRREAQATLVTLM